MADPFSLASGAAGVISVALTISKGLLDYYESYKSSGATVKSMFAQLEALSSTLTLLNKIIDRDYAQLDPEVAKRVEESIDNCREGLGRLEKKLVKIRNPSQQDNANGRREQISKHVQRATFPFKESTLIKLKEVAMELRSDLGLTLDILQIDVSAISLQRLGGIDDKIEAIEVHSADASANILRFGQDIETIGDILVGSEINEQRTRILEWLQPPDPFANQDNARQKHIKSTNEWFLKSDAFGSWLHSPESLLLVYGIPGSGKTILASTVINEVEDAIVSSNSVILYYYFDFNDRQKQTVSGCVSSLLVQLAFVTDNFERLWNLFLACGQGRRQPTVAEVTETLRHAIGATCQVYLVLDALDECSELDVLLGLVVGLYKSKNLDLRFLATCRKERSIDLAMDPLNPVIVNLSNELITRDIQTYVQGRLGTDTRLKKWCLDAEIKLEIEKTLSERADGMFRWVVCQLDALQKCLTAASLKKTLRSLPKSLYDTYDRILLSIDPSYRQQATQVLQFLVVARRPLYVEEAAEVVTICPTAEDDTPSFDADNRLLDPNDVFQLCLSLVSTAISTDSKSQNGQLVPAEFLRLAHFSVKEYLISGVIRQGPCSDFFVNEIEAHVAVSQTCITYLLSLGGLGNDKANVEHPLAEYAAKYWNIHAELAFQSDRPSKLENRVIELLESVRTMSIVHTLCKPHYPTQSLVEKPALHWATQYGLSHVVERILTSNENINLRDSARRTALHIAIQFRKDKIARFLLTRGIDVDGQDLIGTALHYAVHTEDVSTVQLVLDGGADPNLRTGLRTTPLYSAAQRNDLGAVKILLAHGADPNAPCQLTNVYHSVDGKPFRRPRSNSPAELCRNGTALQVAAWRGFPEVVRALLDAGAVIESHELVLLSEGKIQEALETVERIGEYPYHFLNDLPDYQGIVEAFKSHTLEAKESERGIR